MCWTGWPNARNIFNFFSPTCQCLCALGPWRATNGPSAHALVQKCCVNVAKRVHHHATSKMLHETEFDYFQIWSNIIQHVATDSNRVAKRTEHVEPNNVARCCVEMLRAFGQAFKLPKSKNFYERICEFIEGLQNPQWACSSGVRTKIQLWEESIALLVCFIQKILMTSVLSLF